MFYVDMYLIIKISEYKNFEMVHKLGSTESLSEHLKKYECLI